ncbi:hypothetical protein DA2_0444 [Desulfovibrio sp. A2]|nr:hypothetical protein DA2_0444 [Desulfovibrio sp. A2]
MACAVRKWSRQNRHAVCARSFPTLPLHGNGREAGARHPTTATAV